MKHSFITYVLAAGLTAAALPACVTDKAETAKTPEVKTPSKPLTAKEIADAKRKEAEAKRKAEREAKWKAEQEARRIAAEKEKELNKKREALFTKFKKEKVPYRERIETCLKLMDNPEWRVSIGVQNQLASYAVDCCRPYYMGEDFFDTAKELFPVVVEKVVKSDRIHFYWKKIALFKYAYHLCDRKMFAEAEKTVRRVLEFKDLRPSDKAEICVALAHVQRYQDQYDKAFAFCKEAMKHDLLIGTRAASDLAFAFDKAPEAMAVWANANKPYEKLIYFAGDGQTNWPGIKGGFIRERKKAWKESSGIKEAVAFINDKKNDPGQRFHVAKTYLFDFYGTPEMAAARKSLNGSLKGLQRPPGSIWDFRAVYRPFQLGDYRLAAEICEMYAGTALAERPDIRKIHITSLGAVGRRAEAAKLAAEYAADPKTTPIDKMRYRFYEAILTGKSTDGFLKDSGLSIKEQSDVVLSAARQTLTWHMDDLSRKYSADYDKFFFPKPRQMMNVTWSDKPVSGITDWRKIYSKLDRQLCDIPFKGSMDFLETDVATGERSVHFEKGAKIKNFMEVSSVCDAAGLHIFLRVEDENARKIENGFANGIGTEMYFAPGKNQPYVCMGSDPVKGVAFMFHTTYDNKNNRRPEFKNPKSFRQETEFTDEDYVLHMFFAWDDFFMKLPAVSGTDYRYECLSWTPAGGFSWGGSQGIHGASDWGTLRIDLTEQQLNAIRRKLIYKTYKTWKQVSKDPGIRVNPFDKWADPEIGDPDFYKTMLQPLEKELDSYAAKVKENMTDAEVEEIYTKGCIRWMGVRDEIDQLRKQYLLRRLTETGK